MHLRRPLFAGIIAVLALFVALGGSAVAWRDGSITNTTRAQVSVLVKPNGAAGPRGPQGERGPQGLRGPQSSKGSDGSSAAGWVTAIAAILAFVVAAVAIGDNRSTARRRVTYEYIARLGDPELIEHQAVMSSFLRGGLRPPSIPEAEWEDMHEAEHRDAIPAVWKHLSKSSSVDDRRRVLQILAYPNMLEGFAGVYNRRLLDRGIVEVGVEKEAEFFLEQAASWLAELRSQDSSVFRDIEMMAEKLAKPRRPRLLRWLRRPAVY
jgi:hypothetical protein